MKIVDDALYLIIGSVVLVGAVTGVYFMGKNAGENKVELAWTQEKKKLADEVIRLKDVIRDKQATHQDETDRVNKELRDAKTKYEKSLSDIRLASAERLRKSETRADVYKRMSEGAESERGHLASHAAKLDRSLEEGRLLVGELQATLRQRDKELISLGSQIKNDRKLFDVPAKQN